MGIKAMVLLTLVLIGAVGFAILAIQDEIAKRRDRSYEREKESKQNIDSLKQEQQVLSRELNDLLRQLR